MTHAELVSFVTTQGRATPESIPLRPNVSTVLCRGFPVLKATSSETTNAVGIRCERWKSISREHARLSFSSSFPSKSPKSWFIEDLNSNNGVFVNMAKLTPGTKYRLQHGDRIDFGGDPLLYTSAASFIFICPPSSEQTTHRDSPVVSSGFDLRPLVDRQTEIDLLAVKISNLVSKHCQIQMDTLLLDIQREFESSIRKIPPLQELLAAHITSRKKESPPSIQLSPPIILEDEPNESFDLIGDSSPPSSPSSATSIKKPSNNQTSDKQTLDKQTSNKESQVEIKLLQRELQSNATENPQVEERQVEEDSKTTQAKGGPREAKKDCDKMEVLSQTKTNTSETQQHAVDSTSEKEQEQMEEESKDNDEEEEGSKDEEHQQQDDTPPDNLDTKKQQNSNADDNMGEESNADNENMQVQEEEENTNTPDAVQQGQAEEGKQKEEKNSTRRTTDLKRKIQSIFRFSDTFEQDLPPPQQKESPTKQRRIELEESKQQ